MKHRILFSSLIGLFISLSATYGQREIALKEADITYMLEEEKLARDVYLALYNKWEHPTFKNITGSEQRHFEKMQELAVANKVSIPMSVEEDEAGIFQNKALQKLYKELVKEGRSSLKNALKVGAKIEELDIKDLKEAIGNTEDAESVHVYENLIKASENHLRAFVRNLKKIGVDYQPVILNQSEYNPIISSEKMGKKGRRNKGQATKKNCTNKKGKGKKCCTSK